MKTYKFIQQVILSALLGLLISCSGNKKVTQEAKEAEVLPADIVELRNDQIKLANIQTGSIEMRSLSGNLKVNGSVGVSPENLATVCMPFGGFVKSANLMPGNAVTKGQTLAILENQEFIDIQQNYLEAKSKLEFTEADYKRHAELFKEDVYSQKNLQQVTADYKSLKAQVHALEQKLALIGINPANLHEDDITRAVAVVSPITGYVKAVNINIGKYVAPTDVLFEIVNSDKLYLELTLFEKDADKVSAGQKIRFFINNEAEQHEAVIYQTGRSVNADKTYKVYATVDGKCKNVLPGMYVNAIIEASTDSVTSLPAEAIVSFDDKDYIFVFDKNKKENGKPFTEYRMIEVQKGVTDGGYTEVILPKGFDVKAAKVVIKGAYSLLSAKKNAGEMAC
ncbi:MAG: efflux RND transporter periplasmic adaptor subunit [Bacteroidetes bacterium]|nr:efflux RND transporter periplasmic adaptor subunit [Bacteroidota bacterium]